MKNYLLDFLCGRKRERERGREGGRGRCVFGGRLNARAHSGRLRLLKNCQHLLLLLKHKNTFSLSLSPSRCFSTHVRLKRSFSVKTIKFRLRAVWPDWAIYWTLGNFPKPLATISLPKSPTLLGNFCKGVQIYHFSSEIIFGQLL